MTDIFNRSGDQTLTIFLFEMEWSSNVEHHGDWRLDIQDSNVDYVQITFIQKSYEQ